MARDLPRRITVLVAALLVLAALAFASVCVGAGRAGPGDAWEALTAYAGTDEHVIVRDIRVPRTIIAVFVGAALGTAGTLIQTLTRNPLAEPGVLGVNAGAGFAITVGAAAGFAGSSSAQLGLALAGAGIAMLVVYGVGRTFPLRLVLAGVALTFVLQGLSMALRLAYPDALDRFRFWSVGALAGRERLSLELPLLAIGLALASAMVAARPLAGLALGENVAQALGARVARVRLAALALFTVLAGASTAIAGPIAFVGLMVPHLARRAAGGSVPWLMAYTMVLGPVLLVASDIGSRVLLPTGEVPVAIVTAFVGAPVLIWAVRRYGAVAL
ncbi:iron ABC transporter permease [Actinomadura sp. WMMB 499]|uniref:FecCD family ABC transporter permease n=1 Tax=Actinomadura sp. WMMB 499 TaxID=1219491 RepID=UPI001248CD83|nr:iron chelate uptake ABC transporter family permease subunit [Actinomadura sp. WMMB 499]QFG20423.1 iron chelate uptake ABC transporter family permease subunit [Actinomadura sp. WMMB 499]